jgi:hypothetical protein
MASLYMGSAALRGASCVLFFIIRPVREKRKPGSYGKKVLVFYRGWLWNYDDLGVFLL